MFIVTLLAFLLSVAYELVLQETVVDMVLYLAKNKLPVMVQTNLHRQE